MASTYLQRTPTTRTNNQKFTFSCWFKKSAIASAGYIAINYESGNDRGYVVLDGNDKFNVYDVAGGTVRLNILSNFVLRDTNAWYHLVYSVDSTAGSNRVKFYINGVDRYSDFTVTTAMSQNSTVGFQQGTTSNGFKIGSQEAGSTTFSGLMSHVNFVDGLQLDASSFGETDTTTGQWKIKTSPTVSEYGNNGFFILKNSNSVTDQSGKGNNLTVGAGTLTNTLDCPSNVFATFNLLARNASNTYANGNTTYDYGDNYQKTTSSTLATNNKKIYAEFKILRSTTIHIGIVGDTFISDGRTVNDTGASWTYDMKGHTGAIALQTASDTGNIYVDGSDTSTDVDFTTTTNDIVMIAFDPTTKKIWWGKNGTWSSSGNPSTGANASYTYSGTATSDFCFAVASEGSSAGAISANFGNGYFGTTAVASAGTNASGNGIFEYDTPTGYTALSTKGLNL